MITDKAKNACTGCTACMNICPQNCITMEIDQQGFLYPTIDQKKCIQCGACDRICEQADSKIDDDFVRRGFGAIAKDKELQLNSSSGGVFSLLCDQIISENGAIFGVALSEDNKSAVHKVAYNKDEAAFFRGAKYLQSDIGDSYTQVKEILKEGKKVLFSGTPCQIDGLKAYLGKEDDNLLYVDVICHGVPSPMVWQKYCDEIERKYKGSISFVSFRHKKYSWEKPNVKYTNAKKVVFRSKSEDPFMRLFLNDYSLRPSCYECMHKGIDRKSDITIADFWGVDKIIPGFSNGAGVSLVTIHTEKGLMFFNKIKDYLVIQEVEPQQSYKHNGAALRSAKRPERLDEFWKELADNSIEGLADKYTPINVGMKSRIKKSAIYGLLKKNKKINMENGICFVIY